MGQKFLRGWQKTGTDGRAKFTTIYPGWYKGRAVHKHFKIRTTTPTDQSYEFTSQLFFDDALSDQVFNLQPYAAKGQRDTRNSNDQIYSNGGDQMTLAPSGDPTNGLSATFNIARGAITRAWLASIIMPRHAAGIHGTQGVCI